MLLRLPSGFNVAIPPFLFWESRRTHLKIRSGSAFYPAHVTSRLCLDILDRELDRTPRQSLLDIGCGSGILALTAAGRGVPFVAGLDIDPRAVRVSLQNAELNGLLDATHWIIGASAAVCKPFECLAANLPQPVLMELIAEMADLLAPEGCLILSGFHDIQYSEVKDRLLSCGLEVREVRSGDQSFYGPPPSGSYTWMALRAENA